MKLTDERTTLFQWDTGRSVTADSAQVHFSNKQLGRSFDVDVKDGVALIPDMLLTATRSKLRMSRMRKDIKSTLTAS